jgi:hypothetical protein
MLTSININSRITAELSVCKGREYPLSTRLQALSTLQSLPHRNRDGLVVEAVTHIMSDSSVPIPTRLQLLNRPGYTSQIYRRLHTFCFNNYSPPRYDISIKIASARYLLLNCNRGEIQYRDITNYLHQCSQNMSLSDGIRYECRDILQRIQYEGDQGEMQDVYHQRIQDPVPVVLPLNPTTDIQRSRVLKLRTTYDDGQNVHTTAINESVWDIISGLKSQYGHIISPGDRTRLLSEVSMRITAIRKTLGLDPVQTMKINGSFDRIMSDTSDFGRSVLLADVLIMVYCEIKNSPHCEEMEKRLIQELEDMNGMCATGHLSRLVNVLSGFGDRFSVKISFADQIKNYIFTHYNSLMMQRPDCEELLSQLIDTGEKTELREFITIHSPFSRLQAEFVPKYLTKEKFTKIYRSCVCDYTGIKE